MYWKNNGDKSLDGHQHDSVDSNVQGSVANGHKDDAVDGCPEVDPYIFQNSNWNIAYQHDIAYKHQVSRVTSRV